MKQRSRGLSLIEALVAMAVMAFGMLGLVGVQSTMRLNADIAKQRSEAVRIAQEAMEQARAYGALTGTGSFDAIANSGPTDVTLPQGNATYSLQTTVSQPSTSPPLKALQVVVSWRDRSSTQQDVKLSSSIAGVAPEVGAVLAAPAAGAPSRSAFGRQASIPREASDQGDGTSRFTPPGGGSVGWVFNNSTGFIVKVCDPGFSSCTDANLLLLSGYVRFAQVALSDGIPSAPTSAQSEQPTGTAFAVGVRAALTLPAASTVECAVAAPAGSAVAYYCALPITTSTPRRWSGRTTVYPIDAAAHPFASSLGDADPAHDRVCRYTPSAATGAAAHPATYADVSAPLSNQNFLLIPAGSGTTTFGCPGDDASTPYVDGTTALHQPSA